MRKTSCKTLIWMSTSSLATKSCLRGKLGLCKTSFAVEKHIDTSEDRGDSLKEEVAQMSLRMLGSEHGRHRSTDRSH